MAYNLFGFANFAEGRTKNNAAASGCKKYFFFLILLAG